MICLSEIAIRSSLCDSVATAGGGGEEGVAGGEEEERKSSGEEVFSLLQVNLNFIFSYVSQ